MGQLTKKNKYKQMSKKYKTLDVNTVLAWSKTNTDLAGWRNKLVDISLKLNPNILLDLGGGNGQQIFRIKSVLKKSLICWIVDFADKPKEILNFLKLKLI